MNTFVHCVLAFLGALALTLVLTPVVRAVNKRLGIVDHPSARRINVRSIPRGGGIALLFGVFASYAVLCISTGEPWMGGLRGVTWAALSVLAVALSFIGLADDKWSLPPLAKLAGQVAIALLAWLWAGVGFRSIFHNLPAWADCILTVFWICGAINAFNLIDGLDGLASGIALIATLGMAGSLVFVGLGAQTPFYFAFAGGLLGFLCYNYNPASVFLGDSGSMLIGFVLSVLPLCSRSVDSFVVSVGMPLLAMGVPIFDTALAILRRLIRRFLGGASASAGQVTSADTDHLHHRVLRAMGQNQRKAAWALYAAASALVMLGFSAMLLRSRSGGLWLLAASVAIVVIVRDMSRVELFDAGRLLSSVARDQRTSTRRRLGRLAVPLTVAYDLLALVLSFALSAATMFSDVDFRGALAPMLVRISAVFFFLVLSRVYSTVWSRASISNYVRLVAACVAGSVAASTAIFYFKPDLGNGVISMTMAYALTSSVALVAGRVARGVIREYFYALNCSRLVNRGDVSRVLVYGCGLRYKAFLRELVRGAMANKRIIVGLIDDDLLLKGRFVGGTRVLGTLIEAPRIITELNVDAVVIACDIQDERHMKVVMDTLAPTGVAITHFRFAEETVSCGAKGGVKWRDGDGAVRA